MTFHAHLLCLTQIQPSSNNRGENNGNLSTLQKLTIDDDDEKTIVSASALRFGIRSTAYTKYHSQDKFNRLWNKDSNSSYYSSDFDPELFWDDDVMGYMSAQAAKAKESTGEEAEPAIAEPPANGGKGKPRKSKARGVPIVRQSALHITPAISVSSYSQTGGTVFGASSAQKVDSEGNSNKTSLHNTEVHMTRYQYSATINPSSLCRTERVLTLIDAISDLSSVGGNHSRYNFHFNPKFVALRWTQECASGFNGLDSGFECSGDMREVSARKLIKMVKYGEIPARELYIASIDLDESEYEELEDLGVNVYYGVKQAFKEFKSQIIEDLGLVAMFEPRSIAV